MLSYNSQLEIEITTHAIVENLQETLWQNQERIELKPVAYDNRFSKHTERKR